MYKQQLAYTWMWNRYSERGQSNEMSMPVQDEITGQSQFGEGKQHFQEPQH